MLAPRGLNIAGVPWRTGSTDVIYTIATGPWSGRSIRSGSDGSPNFLVQNVPTISDAPDLAIAQPRIYYGLLGTTYALVDTKPAFRLPGVPTTTAR